MATERLSVRSCTVTSWIPGLVELASNRELLPDAVKNGARYNGDYYRKLRVVTVVPDERLTCSCGSGDKTEFESGTA